MAVLKSRFTASESVGKGLKREGRGAVDVLDALLVLLDVADVEVRAGGEFDLGKVRRPDAGGGGMCREGQNGGGMPRERGSDNPVASAKRRSPLRQSPSNAASLTRDWLVARGAVLFLKRQDCRFPAGRLDSGCPSDFASSPVRPRSGFPRPCFVHARARIADLALAELMYLIRMPLT